MFRNKVVRKIALLDIFKCKTGSAVPNKLFAAKNIGFSYRHLLNCSYSQLVTLEAFFYKRSHWLLICLCIFETFLYCANTFFLDKIIAKWVYG